MTVPFPLDAFDDAQPVRRLRRRPQVDTDKLAGIGITIAVHAVILALALTVTSEPAEIERIFRTY